jgi:hypothetical protein
MATARDLQPEESNKRAALRNRFGDDVAEIVDNGFDNYVNEDWADVQAFVKYVDDDNY